MGKGMFVCDIIADNACHHIVDLYKRTPVPCLHAQTVNNPHLPKWCSAKPSTVEDMF